MLFGAILSRLTDDEDAAAALNALGDLVLFARVEAMGQRFEESAGEYAAGATRRFANGASDEEWLALMSALERGGDPARVSLERMVRWALAEDEKGEAGAPHAGCSCAGGGGCHEPA